MKTQDVKADNFFKEWHPAANAFPLMDSDQLEALASDIERNGQRIPIELDENNRIVDGRNRQAACLLAGVDPKYTTVRGLSFEDTKARVWSLNVERRQLTKGQRDAAAVQLESIADEAKAKAKERKAEGLSEGGKRRHSASASVDAQAKPKSRASAEIAKRTGTSSASIERAQAVKKNAPDLLEEMEAGKLTTNAAYNQMRKRQKKAELEQKAAEAEFLNDEPEWTLIENDVLKGLQSVIDHHAPARLIFADPPYNIGVDYGPGSAADNVDDAKFLSWCRKWFDMVNTALADDGSFWLMINDEYAAEFGVILKECGFVIRSWIKWYETFGVNNSQNFNRTSRHIFYAVKDPTQFVFHASEVSRPSDRQIKYNDKRASPDGKILDDVWTDIPRLTGTSSERMPDVPTQLPLSLVSRIVRCASDPGDLVVDPFNGSGTTGEACIRSNRKYIGIDRSSEFIHLADLRLKAVTR